MSKRHGRPRPPQPGGWNEGDWGPKPPPKTVPKLRILLVAGDGGRELLVTDVVRELGAVTKGWRPTMVVVPVGRGTLEEGAVAWAEEEGIPVVVSTPPPRPEGEQLDGWGVWAAHWLKAADEARVLVHDSGQVPVATLPPALRRGWYRVGAALQKRAGQLGVKVRRVA